MSINYTSVLAKADFFHTCEYIHIQLANSNIVKISDLSRKKNLAEAESEVEVKDWIGGATVETGIHSILFPLFLSARGSRSNSRWLPGTNLFTGIPRVIPTGVPWESWQELAKIPA